MKRLRELEEENSRLKRIVADLSLDKEMLRTSSSESSEASPASASWWTRCAPHGKCRCAEPAVFFGLIQRYRYRSRRPGQAGLESRIKEICQTRVRYGYRRVHFMLRREGWVINEKRTRQVYNEMGMQLRSKTPKRRVKAALRADRTPPSRSNEVWAMDFVHDQLATGTMLRILTVRLSRQKARPSHPQKRPCRAGGP